MSSTGGFSTTATNPVATRSVPDNDPGSRFDHRSLPSDQPPNTDSDTHDTEEAILTLSPTNASFSRRRIVVPFWPKRLSLGRRTSPKDPPECPTSGRFESKVLSRSHSEVWADRDTGQVWIRDTRSSNGTFVNGVRLSDENRESEPHRLQQDDELDLGIDIVGEDGVSVIHHRIAARVEHAGFAATWVWVGVGGDGPVTQSLRDAP